MKKLNAFHMRNLKQALNHGLVFKKDYRVIKVNRNAWLKPYINMNRDLTKKKCVWKNFFQLMNSVIFGKTMENVRKNRY